MEKKPSNTFRFFALLRMILVRNFPPLKVIGFAFRKDKGTFISGAKENNSCARDGADVGREIGDLFDKQYGFILKYGIDTLSEYLKVKNYYLSQHL